MKLHSLLLMALLSVAGIISLNGQNIYYVTQHGAGSRDGTDWADAYDVTTFRSLLSTANYGSTFWLASGTYTPGNGRDSSFFVPSGVKIYGGFPSTGNPTFADRNITANPTILSGEIGTPQPYDNCYHIIQIRYADTTTIIDGLTISDGYSAASSGANQHGIGIYNDGSSSNLVGSSPLIINCTFKNNTTQSGVGAAIYNNGLNNGKSDLKIINCTFIKNTAASGGAIYNDGQGGESSAFISQCTFISNTASTGSAISNSGAYNGYNATNIVNSLFVKNFATGQGTIANDGQQGVGIQGCYNNIINCTFAFDTANGGASVVNSYTHNSGNSCITTLINCILWDNTLPLIGNSFNYPSITNVNYSDIQGGYMGTNNLAIDPMFVDVNNGNYLIASCSPCVNRGTDSLAPHLDIDSTVGPIKGKYDMGAYESKDTGIIAASIALSVSPNDTFCANVNAIFTATTNTTTPSYRWQINGVTSGTNSPTFTNSALHSGDVISCKITSTASCLSPNNATGSLQVYVKPAAIAGFTYTRSGNSYDFTDASIDAVSIKWLFGDGDSSATSNPFHTYSGNSNDTALLIAYNDCGADTFKQAINLATGINNIVGNEIKIYPNPTTDYLLVSYQGPQPTMICILDMKGQKLVEQGFASKIDVSSLSNGVYIVEVKGTSAATRQKFLKL